MNELELVKWLGETAQNAGRVIHDPALQRRLARIEAYIARKADELTCRALLRPTSDPRQHVLPREDRKSA